MSPALQAVAALLLSLGGIEGLSYAWTHPQPGPYSEVVMARLPTSPGLPREEGERLVPLPEVYEKSAPMLRCSNGEVFFREQADGIALNLSFFEWRGADTGSVLEAFRHMPEICLGSVGLKLVSTELPQIRTVDGKTIVFDHTVFRDPGSGAGSSHSLIHSFRGIWVAGADAADGLSGDATDRLRAIRFQCAIRRFRPPYACVIQGAVRGALTGEAAWEAFERSMLSGMSFQAVR